MKRVIVTTIAALMFACVLPMAQGQAKAAVADETSEQQNDAQVSRELAELKAKLEKLEIERLKLQQELKALAQARAAEGKAKQAAAEVKKAKADAKKATAEAAKAKDAAVKAATEGKKAKRAIDEAVVAKGKAEKQQKWATEMEAWAEQMEQWQDGEEMQEWQEAVQQWQHSEEFKDWQKEVQRWGRAQARAQREGDGALTEPTPPMPPMPAMPPVPAAPVSVPAPDPTVFSEIRIPAVSVATSAPFESVVVMDADVDATESVSVEVKADASAEGPDGLRMIQSVREKKEGNNHVLVRTEQTTMKLAPGSALSLINEDGTISIAGTDRGVCQVQSVFTLKAPTADAAKKLSKAVHLETKKTDKGLAIIVAEPAKMPSQHSSRVDLQILVPRNTGLSVKHGDGAIRIKNIDGHIAAFLEDGEIRCEDVEGVMAVRLEDGRVVIDRARLAACSVHMEDGQLTCEDIITGSLDVELEDGVIALTYGDEVPENCEIHADLSDGSIRLSAPKAMFPPDAPAKAKRLGDGAEWNTTAETATGERTVTLRVGDGSVKVEKR